MLDTSQPHVSAQEAGDPAFAGGFADQVHGAQRTFRSVMNAMAQPGTKQPVDIVGLQLDKPSQALAAVALTLCDPDTPVWLDDILSNGDFPRWLAFHTGAPICDDPSKATFAFSSDLQSMPNFELLSQGSEAYPDRSTTLVVDVAQSWTSSDMWLAGPGIDGTTELAVGALPADFLRRMAANHALFPRGIDLIFAGDGEVLCLPRTTRISRKHVTEAA
ncbi:MAG: phosphonate C-P lyase system protein PhnH [Pseudomonadota bacterium]